MNNEDIVIYELYTIWYRPFWRSYWFIGISLSIAIGIIIFLIWYFYTRSLQRDAERKPWQKTLKKLDALSVPSFTDASTHKMFYTMLIGIIKEYFSIRYKMNLSGKTDQEILRIVADIGLSKEMYEHFASVIEGAMTIKFASQASALEQMRGDVMKAVNIIRDTIPYTGK